MGGEKKSWLVRTADAVFGKPQVRPRPHQAPTNTDEVIQGKRLLSEDELAQAAEALLRRYGEEFAWPLGPFRLPHANLYNHVLLIGAPGSGKSTIINQIKRNTLGHVKSRLGHRACIWDYRSEELQHLASLKLWGKRLNEETGRYEEGSLDTACPVSYINPADTRGVGVDIAKDVTNELDADQFAHDMIAPKAEEGSDGAVWVEGARNCISQVVQTFQNRVGSNWQLIDVVKACLTDKKLSEILKLTAEGRDLLDGTLGTHGQAKGVMLTIQGFAKKLRPIAAAMSRRPCISLNDWVTKNEGIIVIGNNTKLKDNLAPLQRWIFGHLTRTILLQDMTREKRYLFFLDEVRQAPFSNTLNELATNGRAKGACMIAGLQDRSGLKDALGDNKAEEYLGMFDTLVFLRLQSSDTAEWASKFFGKHLKRVSETSEGNAWNVGGSVSHQSGWSSGNYSSSTGRSENWGTSGNQGVSYKEVERMLVFPNEFRDLAKPWMDPQHGLVVESFISIPDVGDGRVRTGQLQERTIYPDPDIAAHMPVTNDDLRYTWTLEDMCRLKLPRRTHAVLLDGQDPVIEDEDGEGPEEIEVVYRARIETRNRLPLEDEISNEEDGAEGDELKEVGQRRRASNNKEECRGADSTAEGGPRIDSRDQILE